MISKLEIKLPGYDTKIPKVVLEYRESTYDEKLKKNMFKIILVQGSQNL